MTTVVRGVGTVRGRELASGNRRGRVSRGLFLAYAAGGPGPTTRRSIITPRDLHASLKSDAARLFGRPDLDVRLLLFVSFFLRRPRPAVS